MSAAEDAERQQQITKRMDRLSRDTAQANALFSSQMREAGNELAKIIGESHVELYELLGMVEAVQSQAAAGRSSQKAIDVGVIQSLKEEAQASRPGTETIPDQGFASPNHTASVSGPAFGCIEAD